MASMEAILDEGVHLVCLRHDEGRARTSVFNVQRSTFNVQGLWWARRATYESGAIEEAMGSTGFGLDAGYDNRFNRIV